MHMAGTVHVHWRRKLGADLAGLLREGRNWMLILYRARTSGGWTAGQQHAAADTMHGRYTSIEWRLLTSSRTGEEDPSWMTACAAAAWSWAKRAAKDAGSRRGLRTGRMKGTLFLSSNTEIN